MKNLDAGYGRALKIPGAGGGGGELTQPHRRRHRRRKEETHGPEFAAVVGQVLVLSVSVWASPLLCERRECCAREKRWCLLDPARVPTRR